MTTFAEAIELAWIEACERDFAIRCNAPKRLVSSDDIDSTRTFRTVDALAAISVLLSLSHSEPNGCSRQ
jgi:hypothetical protein